MNAWGVKIKSMYKVCMRIKGDKGGGRERVIFFKPSIFVVERRIRRLSLNLLLGI